jgi:hypothetical protein
MGFLGKILSLPVKIVNVPLVVVDKITGADKDDDAVPELGYLGKKIAEALEEIDE